jgi:uncharacterized protein YpiB (UPF0302 family)
MSPYNEIVGAARTSWLSNYTQGDKQWRLKQLHGLHQLVINNRDVIVSALATGMPPLLFERSRQCTTEANTNA